MPRTTHTGTLLNHARSDRVLLAYCALLVAASIPYFLPMLSEDWLFSYDWITTSLFLLPSVSLLLWPWSRREMSATEIAFWKILSFAFMFWWVGGLLNWLLPAEAWTIPVSITADSIYLGYYVCWLGAISLVFRKERGQSLLGSGKWLHVSALLALAFWLFAYFILIPSQFMPNAYATWVPSLLFYAALDLALALLFIRLVAISSSGRWKVLFSLMAAASFVFCILDVLESLTVFYEFAWGQKMASSVIWTLPYPIVALFARARHYPLNGKPADTAHNGPTADSTKEFTNPILLLSFLPPVIHLTLGQLLTVDNQTRLVQESVVLGSLVVFWLLAILENRHVRQLTRSAQEKEEELARMRLQQQVTEETQKAKGRFMANVSHEIRTPLSGILGMVELQLLDEPDADKRHRAELVKDSARSLTKIIDDILEYSSIETGDVLVSHEPFELDAVAREANRRLESGAKAKGLELTLEIEQGTPTRLVGDASRLLQVLTALVANGIKFSERGGVHVRFSAQQPDPRTAIIQCRVTDTGIGIDEDNISTLFLPFSQGDESSTRKFGGTGLGLAIAKQVVESQCGRIGARNNPEGGATFWFEIAYAVDETAAEAAVAAASLTGKQGPTDRVLLAEDERTCQLVTAKQLECLGYHVDIAKDGREALSAASQKDYDIVLMDCRMPLMDGLEATRRIRALDTPRKDVPIIALTAHTLEIDRQHCRQAGMDDFLVKPASMDDLRQVLSKWLPPVACQEH